MKLRPCSDEHGQPAAFDTLMALQKVDHLVFESMTKAFQPGGPLTDAEDRPRAYGGHIYAQAAWAAAQTVSDGFVISSVSGFFILMGFVDMPFTYKVRILRDGRSYCIRAVDVTQDDSKGIVFTCTCSFKKPDSNPIEFQERLDINKIYASVLEGKRPEDHPDAPSLESLWFLNNTKARAAASPLPGLRTQKVDMTAFNQPRLPLDRRRLTFYCVVGAMPPVLESPNLHACAHLYACDRNSLFTITDSLNIIEHRSLMASLNYTVIFHTSAESLSMIAAPNEVESGVDKWFVQEAWTDRLGDGRGVHHSRIWDSEGKHVATTIQDGMIRLKFKSDEELATVKKQIESGRAKI